MDKHCRICHNTSCSNHGKNISFLGDGWKCNYIPVPTNADRIRSMSDKKLAEIIVCPKGLFDRMDCFDDNRDCKHCTLEWLKQPAEDNKNG